MEKDAQDPDAALIPELVEGREYAFRRLWETYARRIYRFVRLRSRSDEDAEEITVDTFVRCHKGIGKFKGQSKLATWLFRLADNAAADYYHRKHVLPNVVALEDVSGVSVVNAGWIGHALAADPHEQALLKERRHNFFRVLSQLSRDHQRVIILRAIEGFSLTETEIILRRSEGAVKMLFLRASQELARLIRTDAYFTVRGGR